MDIYKSTFIAVIRQMLLQMYLPDLAQEHWTAGASNPIL